MGKKKRKHTLLDSEKKLQEQKHTRMSKEEREKHRMKIKRERRRLKKRMEKQTVCMENTALDLDIASKIELCLDRDSVIAVVLCTEL